MRLPVLKDITCPATPELACKLSGSNLYLVDSLSNDRGFEHPVQVPDGFLGSALPVPHPTAGSLYVKLRDDPSVINLTSLNVIELSPSPNDPARSAARQASAPLEKHPPATQKRSDEADPAAERNHPDP